MREKRKNGMKGEIRRVLVKKRKKSRWHSRKMRVNVKSMKEGNREVTSRTKRSHRLFGRYDADREKQIRFIFQTFRLFRPWKVKSEWQDCRGVTQADRLTREGEVERERDHEVTTVSPDLTKNKNKTKRKWRRLSFEQAFSSSFTKHRPLQMREFWRWKGKLP